MAVLTVPFTINVTGDQTGDVYTGRFETKIRLSHRDTLQRDRLFRSYLGAYPEGASEEIRTQCLIFADLATRLVKAPSWWTESDNGLDLFDNNVVLAVFAECARIEREERERVLKEGKAAYRTLRNLPENIGEEEV